MQRNTSKKSLISGRPPVVEDEEVGAVELVWVEVEDAVAMR
jgi:hypothetical protein